MNPHTNPEVSFTLQNILQINGRIIESVDTTPYALSETITSIEPELTLQMEKLRVYNESIRPSQPMRLRPVILIARLALFDQPYNALTQQALRSRQHHFTHASALTEEAFVYWNEVKNLEYHPYVSHLASTEETTGVWLGIFEKE
ncbi:hypothetical protein H7200_01915 [Candidatus Saccharibacteria bacterium]|nr:hypothetical protein [Candidatus Saccharibacteria bacterium]